MAGRRAVHGRRRRLHLQLHHQEQPPEPGRLHRRHHRRQGDRTNTVEIYTKRAQGEHAAHGRPDPARAHLDQGQRQGGQPPPSRTRRRSSARAPSRSSSGRRASSSVSRPTRTTGAARPRSTRSIFTYTNPDTMAQDLKLGSIDGAIDVPPPSSARSATTPGITANKAASWQFTELGMNCYDSPNSLGNPVLRDQQFRQAVNWAVDREKVVSHRLQRLRPPGSTLIVPYSKYHWQPPAGQPSPTTRPRPSRSSTPPATRTSTATATARPRTARSSRCASSPRPTRPRTRRPASSSCWFKDVGIKVDLSVVDSGALTDAQYNYKGNTYTPDWDMFIWYWTQDVDPEFMLGIYTPPADRRAGTTACGPTRRTPSSQRAATTIDGASASRSCSSCSRSSTSRAVRDPRLPVPARGVQHAKWQGWMQGAEPARAALYNYNNIDTYRNLSSPADDTSTGGGARDTTIVLIVVAVVVVAGVAPVARAGGDARRPGRPDRRNRGVRRRRGRLAAAPPPSPHRSGVRHAAPNGAPLPGLAKPQSLAQRDPESR